jgi:hypothetical protein
MSATSDTALANDAMRRDSLTWYSYLALAFFSYLNSIQGNLIPFLKTELNLTYSEVSLHPSALAVGSVLVGLAGDRVIRRFSGRRTADACRKYLDERRQLPRHGLLRRVHPGDDLDDSGRIAWRPS